MGDRARWRDILVLAPIAARYWQIFTVGEYYETLKKRYSSWAFAMPTRGRLSGSESDQALSVAMGRVEAPLCCRPQATMKQVGGPPHGRYGANALRSCTCP